MKEKKTFIGLLKSYSLVMLLVVFVIVSSILSPNFLKAANLLNMLQQCSVSGIIAIGMTMVIIIGGIDLSVGAVAAFAGMVTSILVASEVPDFVSILAGLGIGAACGISGRFDNDLERLLLHGF